MAILNTTHVVLSVLSAVFCYLRASILFDEEHCYEETMRSVTRQHWSPRIYKV